MVLSASWIVSVLTIVCVPDTVRLPPIVRLEPIVVDPPTARPFVIVELSADVPPVKVCVPDTVRLPATFRSLWNVSAISVLATSESLKLNMPSELSNDRMSLFVVDTLILTAVLPPSLSIMTKLPLLSFRSSVPRVIVFPERNRSLHLLVELPRSYASLLSGIREPVNVVLVKAKV